VKNLLTDSSLHPERSTVSWVGSLLAGVYMTTGPIVGALVNKYGCRSGNYQEPEKFAAWYLTKSQ